MKYYTVINNITLFHQLVQTVHLKKLYRSISKIIDTRSHIDAMLIYRNENIVAIGQVSVVITDFD